MILWMAQRGFEPELTNIYPNPKSPRVHRCAVYAINNKSKLFVSRFFYICVHMGNIEIQANSYLVNILLYICDGRNSKKHTETLNPSPPHNKVVSYRGVCAANAKLWLQATAASGKHWENGVDFFTQWVCCLGSHICGAGVHVVVKTDHDSSTELTKRDVSNSCIFLLSDAFLLFGSSRSKTLNILLKMLNFSCQISAKKKADNNLSHKYRLRMFELEIFPLFSLNNQCFYAKYTSINLFNQNITIAYEIGH